MHHDMTDGTSTWAVVATVHEPPMLVVAFVAWHLSLGASEIMLYFDDPTDPAADLVAALPGVRVLRCDNAHWRRLCRHRPDKHQIRQSRNAVHAYQACSADWLLHCDADEFVWATGPVSDFLSAVQSQTQCVIAPVAERIYHAGTRPGSVFNGAFRRPFAGKRVMGRHLFGRGYAMTHRGLTGHAIGKSFLRRGAPIIPSIHRPKSADRTDIPTEHADALTLLHFDGLTPLHWVYKILRKADAVANHGGLQPSRHRQRQIDAVLADPCAAVDVYHRLKQVDAGAMKTLMRENLVLEAEFAPDPAVAAHFPELDTAFSAEAVDRWLWDNKSALLDSFGLKPPR